MRHLLSATLSAFALLSVCACGSDSDDEPVLDHTLKENIVLRSATVAEGAEVKASELTTITLAYSENVMVSPDANITLNGMACHAASNRANVMKVDVSLPALEDGQLYTLSVPAGSILRVIDPLSTAPSFTLTFSTKADIPVLPTSLDGLSNPLATAEARNVYDFLKSIYGQKQLSGVQSSMSNTNDFVNNVNNAVGKHPALAGYDFIFLPFSPTPPGWEWVQNYGDISAAREQWQNHGLVSYMWHWNVPNSEADFRNCVDHDATDHMGFYISGDGSTSFDIREALKEGTWQHRCIMRDIEEVAGYLSLLQKEGIPVIFRPLHEAAGNYTKYDPQGGAWFWWGRYGAEPCKQLYRLLHQQLTEVYGLNNLIWVWTIDVVDGMERQAKDWYPGHDVVDIVGVDVYTDNVKAPLLHQYETLTATVDGRKMTTISECGNIPNPDIQLQSGLSWLWFMVWPSDSKGITGAYKLNTQTYWKQVTSSPCVLNREDMPDLR